MANEENKSTSGELSAEEKVQQDVESKIAEAAAEVQDEINAAEEPEEVVETNGDDFEVPTYESAEEVNPALAVPVKKKVSISKSSLVLSLIGCAVAGALILFIALSIPSWMEKLPEGSTIATVNGEKVTDLDMGYYLYTNAMNYLYENDEDNAEDFKDYDWSQTAADGRTAEEVIKDRALREAVSAKLTNKKGLEKGVEWTEDNIKQIETQVNSMESSYGEDTFKSMAQAMGLNNKKQYIKMFKEVSLYGTVTDDIKSDITAYVSDASTLNNYANDYGASAKHVLIKTSSAAASSSPTATAAPADPAADEAALAKANDIAVRAQSGEDFDALIDEANEDTGEGDEGYTFKPGEMQPEFEEAVFALGIGDVSNVVQTSYGYHVIKRIAGLYEIQQMWYDEAKVDVKNSAFDKISLKDLMNSVADAQAAADAAQSAAQG